MLRRIIFATLAVMAAAFVVIQVIPVDRSNPPVVADIGAPPHVDSILRRSCYDCHSNETRWPWYSNVALASWLVARDVREGRAALNFSTWGPNAQPELMNEILESVDERKMPMKIYLTVHPGAALSEADVAAVREWGLAQGASTEDSDIDRHNGD